MKGSEELMSVLGHELRSPLTAIRGAASLLLMAGSELPAEKVNDLLRLIDSQSSRMADRIDDVLIAGRLDGGRDLHLVGEEVELSEVLADVLADTRDRTADRRIRATGAAGGLAVAGDRVRVAQVIRLLVDNALRYSPSGSPVEVRVSGKGGRARIEVRDRGRGVEAGDRRRVFERGVKLDPGGPGAGLGLYVAGGLVAAMGGETGIDARPGGGSVSWFTLPLAGPAK